MKVKLGLLNKKANNSLKDVLAKGFEYDKHYRMVLKDGSFIDVNINAAVAKNVSGEYIRTICMIDKITT